MSVSTSRSPWLEKRSSPAVIGPTRALRFFGRRADGLHGLICLGHDLLYLIGAKQTVGPFEHRIEPAGGFRQALGQDAIGFQRLAGHPTSHPLPRPIRAAHRG